MKLVIVGGGFVGSAVACHLIRTAAAGSQLTLVNAGGQLARGLAYGTRSSSHLLNVPAARMGWDDAAPRDFADWLAAEGLPHASHAFVPRSLYGDYLGQTLQRHVETRADVAWHHHRGSVSDLRRNAAGNWSVQLHDGSTLEADRIVLALGNFAPTCPLGDFAALPSDLYVADPWHPQALAGLAPEAGIAIVGSGLTMLDVLVSLDDAGHRGPVFALSRRGLLPQSHRENELPPQQWHPEPGWPGSGEAHLKTLLHEVRRAVAAARSSGGDWRDVFGGLRPITPALWRALSSRDRAQFLRHLQPLWDVHRHRAAPAARARLERMRSDGQLTQAAGRLLAARPIEGQVLLEWHARGERAVQSLRVDRVFNCSGPSSRLRDDRSGLFPALHAAGRLQVCPHGLGVLVDDRYRLLDASGEGQPGLFYAGPLLKAQYWEATAVPELRQHAAAVARACLAEA